MLILGDMRQMAVGGVDLADIGFDSFCDIMGSVATGVSVLTSLDETGPHGLTCSAVCSVSAAPPLLLSCVRTPSSTLDAIRGCNRFLVNVLAADARELSNVFASRRPDKFAGVAWQSSERLGMPLLEPTVAYAECTVHDLVTAGDHVIVLGRIVGGRAVLDRSPLGYWRGGYVDVVEVSPGGQARRR
jgi:flavin reductase (DIM6/NTAB) family NADH-FMN oxidoreductase RutF